MPVVLAYLTCALVWGTTWYAIRASTAPGGFPTLESAALRFVLAAAILAVIVAALRLRPWPRDRATWGWIAIAGVLNAGSYALVYFGEERVPGGLAAVLFSTQPLMLAALLIASGFERVKPTDVVGALIAMAGVGTIVLERWQVSASQVTGLALLLGAVVMSTTYSFVLKRRAGEVHPVVTTWLFLGVTALTLAIAVVVRGPVIPPQVPSSAAILALLYLAIMGSVIAFAAWLWLLRKVSLMVASTLVFVQPVVALIVDSIWEQELRLGPRTYIGIAVVFCGLAFNLRRGRAAR